MNYKISFTVKKNANDLRKDYVFRDKPDAQSFKCIFFIYYFPLSKNEFKCIGFMLIKWIKREEFSEKVSEWSRVSVREKEV